MSTLGDAFKAAASEEVELIRNEVAVLRELVQERKHPLDLVRELLSNSGAKEVEATRIEISYTKDKEGHIFEIADNGCGMGFTGNAAIPGRLDRFLGLGLSAIVGFKSDEFAWKGLGSKLAYQSKRIEIETKSRDDEYLYEVRVNDPWDTICRNLIPKPRITKHKGPDEPHHTKIRVVGHPPHRQEQPFSLEEIRDFLLTRTFAGFTSDRPNPPEIVLSVLGATETLAFGFPVFKSIQWRSGIWLSENRQTLFVSVRPMSSRKMDVRLRGLLTWDPGSHGLRARGLNTGLMLSSKGIPYFTLDLEELGARGITHANPGIEKTCLIVECDEIHTEMNISRSDLVDSAKTLKFKQVVQELLSEVERSREYLEFRQVPKHGKRTASAKYLAEQKKKLERDEQPWVVYRPAHGAPAVLMREPANETEVMALIWKLEGLKALPFVQFDTLAYPGATSGPDLFAHFREDEAAEPVRCAAFEVERNFYSYKPHQHLPAQYPRVVCWDIPTSGRKVRLNPTTPDKPYKFTVIMEDCQVHVYVISRMPGIDVLTKQELRNEGVDI